MPKTQPFDQYFNEYENWFVKYKYIFDSEINLLKKLVQPNLKSLEVGVGSGLFASKLGIMQGIEPSEEMAKIARKRNIDVIYGTAEEIPFSDDSFEQVLMVTTICFVDDPQKAIDEVFRILKPDGHFITAFVDKNTKLGQIYLKNKHKSKFYAPATFFSTSEILDMLKKSGFKPQKTYQTLNGALDEIKEIQPASEGYGEMAFVAIKSVKPSY